MTVHLFGAVSSPSCANYALRRTADDSAHQFHPEVIKTVKHNLYVDDCLKSLATEEEAIRIIKDLTSLCKRGGFNLTKLVSNSYAVLTSLPEHSKAQELMELDLDTEQLSMETALVLQWCIETDNFQFRTMAQT